MIYSILILLKRSLGSGICKFITIKSNTSFAKLSLNSFNTGLVDYNYDTLFYKRNDVSRNLGILFVLEWS